MSIRRQCELLGLNRSTWYVKPATPDAAELAQAIDHYKMRHRRRFITFEEMLAVVKSLGYRR